MLIFKKKRKVKIFTRKLSLQILFSFDKILAFQVFRDLSLFRKWIGVKIFSINSDSEYQIIAQNPKSKEIEIFIPIFLEARMKINFSRDFLKFFSSMPKRKNLNVISLALIDSDSTIAYYQINLIFNKISGPFF